MAVMMTPKNDVLTIVLACLVSGGCVRREITRVEVAPDVMESGQDLRTATNLPQQFTVVTPPATPGDCPPTLRDTGLHATLRLRRSVLRPVPDSAATQYRAVGDYAVEPQGLYGEEEGEGVRVDCSRLQAIGVVRL
jgi:hypothetical protein